MRRTRHALCVVLWQDILSVLLRRSHAHAMHRRGHNLALHMRKRHGWLRIPGSVMLLGWVWLLLQCIRLLLRRG